MQGIRVVIVEDELIAAEYLREILEAEGVEVISIVDSGKEAIDVCIQERPDVVFMDIMLRDNISGSEAAVQIAHKIDTKIIFLTAYVDDETIEYAVESHAAGYLTKPYNEKQIIATLRLAVDHYSHAANPVAQETKRLSNEINLIDDFIYLLKEQRLIKKGHEVELGPKAQKLIGLLCHQPGISISNDQIAMHVWQEPVNDKTLRSLIFRIRAATSEELIRNVSGTGYMVQLEHGD